MFKTEEFSSNIIRQATNEDSEQIIKMLMDAASWLKENGIDQWSYLHSGKENHEIESAILKGTTFVVEDVTGKLIASFNLSSEQNDWDFELWGNNDDQSAYLHRVVVARDQHNKQLGKDLVAWMIDNINLTNGSIRLDCVGHNQILNRFYKDIGFRFIGLHDMGGTLFAKYERTIG
ncbi:GNAT family N-acetyltransferase [Virgibacillus necropolis]|uniref:GNAT family N-acetyltransferase n=1 Tax=Virgibacillus necropolis TaxID=163877 RepID=A0A221MHS5_9BACI|nr:GNAT family N-acetyltransferase [Virgibacillus necropolis]ASN07162.1 GNAT family N-acetyltransferase [Virgibacillus necropolis]